MQLGESGHGVAEFNHAKVRLIKFLHQQMGFDVMAFESGLYECYARQRSAGPALTTMRSCIFGGVAHRRSLALFDYIVETRQTDWPLILAGFDTQISSAIGASTRPAFFAEHAFGASTRSARPSVQTDRSTCTSAACRRGPAARYAVANEATPDRFLRRSRAVLPGTSRRCLEERVRPRSCRNSRNGRRGRCLRYHGAIARRHQAAETISSDRRRRRHPRFRNGEQPDVPRQRSLSGQEDHGVGAQLPHPSRQHRHHDRAQPTMGQWIRERFRDQLYTIGLYIESRHGGAEQPRGLFDQSRPDRISLEWVMANTGSPTLFIDFTDISSAAPATAGCSSRRCSGSGASMRSG